MSNRRDEQRTLTRRETLRSAGVLAGAAVSAPRTPLLLGFGSNTLTPLAAERPDERIEHGTAAIPSWHVTYDEGSKDSLVSWVDDHDDRAIVREHDALDAMTIRAPTGHVGAGFWGRTVGDGLQAHSYVERVDLNVAMGIPEPIRSLSDDDVWDHGILRRERARMGRQSAPSPDGVAFDSDARETFLEDVKVHTNADGVSVDTSVLDVAVIDTGVDAGGVFEDGNGNTRILDASANLLTGETVGADGLDAVADDNGHGNWVAACTAAAPDTGDEQHEGYLPDAGILALKALNADGQGSTARIISAVEIAIREQVDGIVMSLGSALYSEQLADAVATAVDEGIVVVVAAGNDRFATTWTASPSDAPEAISVNATNVPEDPTARDDTQIAYFGNVGPDPGTTDFSGGETADARPDVAAPGMKITALTPNGERTLSGTSMAAPVVLGCLGLLRAAEPDLDVEQLRERLERHSYRLPKVATVESAHGLVDAQAMIDETERDETQAEAMDGDASARDDAYEAYSTAQGASLWNLGGLL